MPGVFSTPRPTVKHHRFTEDVGGGPDAFDSRWSFHIGAHKVNGTVTASVENAKGQLCKTEKLTFTAAER